MADDRKRPPRVLWWLFGVAAGALAVCAVLLYWIVRRPGPPGPSTRPPASPSSPDGGCDVNCGDPCDDACEQAIDGTCGTATGACDSLGTSCNDTGSSCGTVDCGNVECNSAVASGQWIVDTAALGMPWLRARARVTLPAWAGIGAIRVYQRFVSHRLGTRCRYRPTCSEYGVHALRRFGALDGSMVALARIRRCTSAIPLGTVDALG